MSKKSAVSLLVLLAACKKDPPPPPPLEVETVSTLSSTSASPRGSEPPPRCRIEGPDLPLGEETVVGDAIVANGAIYLGVTRKRTGSILKIPLDLSTQTATEVGPVRGEDPPPSPRLAGTGVLPVFYTNLKEAGPSRELAVGTQGNVSQQADESTAFDVVFPPQGPAVVAWDEDAPIPAGQFLADRGQIRVQLAGETEKARVASPFASDAEAPHLALKKGGGFWLAWIAKKIENPDAGDAIEGPGEKRAFRWIEIVALDAKANMVGPVKRLTPEKGRVVAFDLINVGPDVVALTQDEAALADGAGGRIVRYAIDAAGSGGEAKGQDLLEGGVGHAIADIVPPWVAWTDVTEHAHLLPAIGGLGSREPLLDGARVVAADGEKVFAITAVTNGPQKGLVLRALICRK